MELCSDCVSKREYIGDGSKTDFTFNFEYMESYDVRVAKYDDETTEYTDLASGANWNFKNATTIEIQPAPDYKFVIYRCTTINPLKAIFHPGHPVKAQDLNDNFEQLQSGLEDARCSITQLQDHIDDNSGGSGGGIDDAPSDGKIYGRQDGSWVPTESFTTGNITVEPDTPLTRTVSGGQVKIGFDIKQLTNVNSTSKRIYFNS